MKESLKAGHLVAAVLALVLCACSPVVNLYPDRSAPLLEQVLEDGEAGKIVLIHVRGVLSTDPKDGFLSDGPSIVQEVRSRLDLAAEDDEVAAVVLAVDSPGGTVTASDILYHMVMRFREETDKPVVSCFMVVAASGGYYLAAGSDAILAHPTSITGSIGTIFIRPDVSGLMDMVGVSAEIVKSAPLKDMASPFRPSTEEERQVLRDLIAEHNDRFTSIVRENRDMTDEAMEEVFRAGIMSAGRALELGLVDRIGYLEDALDTAAELAGLEGDPQVVVYRRRSVANDSPYNTMAMDPGGLWPSLGAAGAAGTMRPGMYHLWLPE